MKIGIPLNRYTDCKFLFNETMEENECDISDEELLRQRVMERPGGIWADEVTEIMNLDYISSLLLAAKTSGIKVKQFPQRRDYLIYYAGRPMPTSLPPPPFSMHRHFAFLYPENVLLGHPYRIAMMPRNSVMMLRKAIPPASITNVAVRDCFNVEIGAISTPSHFYLLRLGADHDALDEMMQEMGEYYSSDEGRDCTVLALQVGLHLAALHDYDARWYRVVIVRVLSEDLVKVRYVDYGLVKNCLVTQLRSLRRKWVLLPAQAVRARLVGVRPPNRACRWRVGAALYFHRSVSNHHIAACVTAVDQENNVLDVDLARSEEAFTTTRNYEFIARGLIAANYADPCLSLPTDSTELYLFPTFAQMENGTAPSFMELQLFLRKGVLVEAPRYLGLPPYHFAYARMCRSTPLALRCELLDMLQYAYAQRENRTLTFEWDSE